MRTRIIASLRLTAVALGCESPTPSMSKQDPASLALSISKQDPLALYRALGSSRTYSSTTVVWAQDTRLLSMFDPRVTAACPFPAASSRAFGVAVVVLLYWAEYRPWETTVVGRKTRGLVGVYSYYILVNRATNGVSNCCTVFNSSNGKALAWSLWP